MEINKIFKTFTKHGIYIKNIQNNQTNQQSQLNIDAEMNILTNNEFLDKLLIILEDSANNGTYSYYPDNVKKVIDEHNESVKVMNKLSNED